MKEHGIQEYIVWQDDEDGSQVLLIKSDPPARHLLLKPWMLYSFSATSYYEARVKYYAYMKWDPPAFEPFDYPPEEYLT